MLKDEAEGSLMQVARPDDGLDPERELAARIAGGDVEAFAELYDRYFHDLYDFAARSLRDRDAAADVVQSTFTKAWMSLRKGNAIRNPKAWLFAIARNSVVDVVRARKRLVPVAESAGGTGPFDGVDASPSPEVALRDKELASLVWSAATSLSVEEYTLLDLHVRRGLSIDELAETLNIRKGAAYTRISRLKNSLGSSVTVEVLARQGRDNCDDLDRIVSSFEPGGMTRPLRKEVEAHLKTCPRCAESKKKFLSPVEIFAGLAPVAALPVLKGDIWSRVSHTIQGAPDVGDAGRSGSSGRSAAKRATAWTAAAVGTVAIVAVVSLFAGSGTVGVQDPSDVRSTSHTVGVPSEVNVIDIGWSRQDDVRAYSVEWANSEALPDAEPDLPGDASGVSSPVLSAGTWYFNMRTEGDSGGWTSTVHLGPFLIDEGGGSPADEEPPEDDPKTEVASHRTTDEGPVVDLLVANGPSSSGIGPEDGSIDDDGGSGSDDQNGDDGDHDGNGDEPPPVTPIARVGDATLTEDDAEMLFPVELSSPATRSVSLTFDTEPGTATPGADYVPVSGSISIPKGESAGVIPVLIVQDPIDEPDEQFSVILVDALGADLSGDPATGTIVDDDEPPPVPDVSITDVRVVEATRVAVFRISLSLATTIPVSVGYETSDGSALSGWDYDVTAGRASFPPGATEATVTVPIVDDFNFEYEETFTVHLLDPQALNILDDIGVGTIVDDDFVPPPPPPQPEPSESPGEVTVRP